MDNFFNKNIDNLIITNTYVLFSGKEEKGKTIINIVNFVIVIN